MVAALIPSEVEGKLTLFFQHIFGKATGYVCVAFIMPGKRSLQEEFYRYPEELPEMLRSVTSASQYKNAYFCPQLLERAKRTKNTVKSCPTAWADLDTCDPDNLLVKPSVTIESSPGRFQALWCFEDEQYPEVAEDVSQRIAYFHARQGADRSGWDLTQLLRIPLTYNRKYNDGFDVPVVRIIEINRNKYRLSDFEKYPTVLGQEHLDIPFPEEFPAETADQVLDKYKRKLSPLAFVLHGNVPEGSWSEPLWSLQMLCFEAGMSREEVYIVSSEAKCNKYARDNKPPEFLWKDVCRAYGKNETNLALLAPLAVDTGNLAPLLSDEERSIVARAETTFVDRYHNWARSLGDAAPQYHQAGGFVVLSSLLAGNVCLPTSYGNVIPNLWFMILADTTLTRKTTAMDIAMDLIADVDPDAVLATDGSIEGLMTSLSMRPGRPSVFLRDEFSGLLEMMTKRDYYAGMAETLTKLYDGKMQKRVLRKEIIQVKDPILITFAGGIKNRTCGLLTVEHISSGFIPRFVFITAESDPSKVKPIGPPTTRNQSARQAILGELADLVKHYQIKQEMQIQNSSIKLVQPKKWQAEMVPEAWLRYNQLEADMTKAAIESEMPEILTPTFDRLCKSGLKAAILLAAARQRQAKVVIELPDLLKAIAYVEQWRPYTLDVIQNVGKGQYERDLDKIANAIRRRPGVSRSAIMQTYHLRARDADQIFTTLEQRGVITRHKVSRTEQFFPVTHSSKGVDDV